MVYLCQPKGVFILIKYWEDFDMIDYFKGLKKEIYRIKQEKRQKTT